MLLTLAQTTSQLSGMHLGLLLSPHPHPNTPQPRAFSPHPRETIHWIATESKQGGSWRGLTYALKTLETHTVLLNATFCDTAPCGRTAAARHATAAHVVETTDGMIQPAVVAVLCAIKAAQSQQHSRASTPRCEIVSDCGAKSCGWV
jgi:hypothetical protein